MGNTPWTTKVYPRVWDNNSRVYSRDYYTQKKMKWTHKFSWTHGKAISESDDMKLIWEATDPWKLWIGGREIPNFPYFHAEDWGLAEHYAEAYKLNNSPLSS